MNDVVANPGAYGFSEVSAACFDGASVCAEPDSYLFWDRLHPTTAAHRLLAERLAVAVIPEPPIFLLLGIPLLVCLPLARQRAASAA